MFRPGLLLLSLTSGLVAFFSVVWICRHSLAGWRRAVDQHWTERARLLFPARKEALFGRLFIPASFLMLYLAFYPRDAIGVFAVAFCGFVGATLGLFAFDQEFFPPIQYHIWLRGVAFAHLQVIARYGTFIVAAALMPQTSDWRMWPLIVAVLVAEVFAVAGGWLWIGRIVGVFTKADERVDRITRQAVWEVGARVRNVSVVEDYSVGAWAMFSGHILFSRRLVEGMDDAMLHSIARHEASHLAEPLKIWACRILLQSWHLPFLFIRPLNAVLGFPWGFVLIVISVIMIRLFVRLSLRFEKQADQTAAGVERSPLAYAKALEWLYREAGLPVVSPGKRLTHPHAYDRMVAAGMTPDYPRPEPPPGMTSTGRIVLVLYGAAVGIFFVRVFSGALYRGG